MNLSDVPSVAEATKYGMSHDNFCAIKHSYAVSATDAFASGNTTNTKWTAKRTRSQGYPTSHPVTPMTKSRPAQVDGKSAVGDKQTKTWPSNDMTERKEKEGEASSVPASIIPQSDSKINEKEPMPPTSPSPALGLEQAGKSTDDDVQSAASLINRRRNRKLLEDGNAKEKNKTRGFNNTSNYAESNNEPREASETDEFANAMQANPRTPAVLKVSRRTVTSDDVDAAIYRQSRVEKCKGILQFGPSTCKSTSAEEGDTIFVAANPAIHKPIVRSEAWHRDKDCEIRSRPRRKDKKWYGKPAARARWLRARQRQEMSRTRIEKRDPQPAGYGRPMDFGDVAEKELPLAVWQNPAWKKACELMAKMRREEATLRRRHLQRVVGNGTQGR